METHAPLAGGGTPVPAGLNTFQQADPRAAVVLDYYRRIDSGDPDPFAHFLSDAQIYFPKFGIARGPAGWAELGAGMATLLARIAHRVEQFHLVVQGNSVVVEGTTEGELQDGSRWSGGQTPGGRFCSVFELQGAQIARMHVYLDPDYAGQDERRFRWGHARHW